MTSKVFKIINKIECFTHMYFLLDIPSGTSLIIHPSKTSMLNGTEVSFTCTTDAYPPTYSYHFYHMGSHVVSNRYGIYNTQITEEGDYSCSATNAAGSGASEPVTITFIGK